jgi:hypothetical protein
MKKNLLLIFFFAIGLYSLDAQIKEIAVRRVGFQTGVNLPNMIFTNITDPNLFHLEPLTRFNAGFYSESGGSEYFTVHFGLYYSGGGTLVQEIEDGVNHTTSISIDYMKVPWIFNFRTDIYGDLFFTIGGGVYGAFAFAGVMEDDLIIDRSILSRRKENVKEFFILDGGLTFKADFEYTIGKKVLKLGASYDVGIMDISNDQELGQGIDPFNLGARNRFISINFTYMINLNKSRDL